MFKTNKHIGFNDGWLMLGGIPAVAFLMSLIIFGVEKLSQPLAFFRFIFPMGLIYTILFWIVFRQIIILFRRQFPSPENARKRILLQSLAIIGGYFILKVTITPFIDQLFGEEGQLHEELSTSGETVATITVSFLVIAIYEGMYFYNLFQKSELEKARLERANVLSQLEGLRAHVNPHFLFNSLNTLAQLIPEDAERAERFVHKLSKVYRYLLEMREEKLISLKEELDFLRSYKFLLKERFEDKLQFEVNISDTSRGKYIVPLSLQMLIENAIKHNVVSTESPLVIEIFDQKGEVLIVQNNLQRKAGAKEGSTGFGLENIRSRFAFYSEQPVDVIVTNDHFIVTIPLLTIREKELSIS